MQQQRRQRGARVRRGRRGDIVQRFSETVEVAARISLAQRQPDPCDRGAIDLERAQHQP